MSLIFHPAVLNQIDIDLCNLHTSEQATSDTKTQDCSCHVWLKNTALIDLPEERFMQSHSVCLPSMNPVIRIAYWLDLLECAV